MKKTILLRLIVIVSVWISLAGFSNANEHTSIPSEGSSVEKLTEQQRKKKMHKFQEDRLNYIAEIASLNDDEKAWLDMKLKNFDNERAEIWIEMRKVRAAIDKAGSDVTEQEYTEGLNKLVGLHKKISGLHGELVKALQEKFTPKKAYITFDGIRSYNSRVAKRVRRH